MRLSEAHAKVQYKNDCARYKQDTLKFLLPARYKFLVKDTPIGAHFWIRVLSRINSDSTDEEIRRVIRQVKKNYTPHADTPAIVDIALRLMQKHVSNNNAGVLTGMFSRENDRTGDDTID